MKVSDCMAKKPVYVKPNDCLKEVLDTLSENNISGCPVVSSSKVVGIITQTDIINLINVHSKILDGEPGLFDLVLALLRPEKAEMANAIKNTMNAKVRSIMKRNVVSIEAGEDIYNAAALMSRHDIDLLPVTKAGRLAGIISRKDIIRAMDKMVK